MSLFSAKRKNAKRAGAHQPSHDGTTAVPPLSVIDADTVLLKSPRGREEIQTRAHDLPTLARRLLIMADGRHTVRDLARELVFEPNDPGLYETLQQLVDGRYLHISDEYDQRGRGSRHGKRATV